MGSLSWCSYQRDMVNGTNTYKTAKYPITDINIEKLLCMPNFKCLPDEAFLER